MGKLTKQLAAVSLRWPLRPEALTAFLIVLWACELFVVQESTLHEHHYYAWHQPFLHRGVRGILDVLTCIILVTMLPRLLLALVLSGGLIFSAVVLSFENYSGHPLSATMMTSTAGEGASVADAGVAMLPGLAWLLAFTLIIKLVVVWRLRTHHRRPRRERMLRSARLGLAYIAIIGVLNFYKPFTLLLGWESVGGIGSLYGYAPTWAAELILLDNEEILERALARGETQSDRLGRLDADFPIGKRLVFLQVESLDASAVTHEIEGRPVTPELRRLAKTSMQYVIRSEKRTGSCDADFTAIMGGLPSIDMPNYKIAGFPFAESFVKELRDGGVLTSAVHNVKGAFFNRRSAFERIGFDRLYFLEELKRTEKLPFEKWAILDHDMLNWAAADLAETEEKQFSLIITATSHVPFRYTPTKYREFYKGNNDLVPSYLDSIHYVDSAIGAFVDALPSGTIVVIYGDHGAYVGSDEYGYQNRKYDGVPLVPFLIYQAGGDLSALQHTHGQELANSGELTLLDMMTYIHGVTRRSAMGLLVPAPAP